MSLTDQNLLKLPGIDWAWLQEIEDVYRSFKDNSLISKMYVWQGQTEVNYIITSADDSNLPFLVMKFLSLSGCIVEHIVNYLFILEVDLKIKINTLLILKILLLNKIKLNMEYFINKLKVNWSTLCERKKFYVYGYKKITK